MTFFSKKEINTIYRKHCYVFLIDLITIYIYISINTSQLLSLSTCNYAFLLVGDFFETLRIFRFFDI